MKKLTSNQTAIYQLIKKHGPVPDHVLVPIAQHQLTKHQSSSGIRTRRSELSDAGLLVAVDAVKMPSGREAIVWATK